MQCMIDLARNTEAMLLLTSAALGARHAFDADHLSVIDGITRQNLSRSPLLAKLSGVLFSAGHVVVVTIVGALATVFFPNVAAPPSWLETIGLAGSGSILVLLGVLNLKAALAPSGSGHSIAGFRSKLFSVRYGWLSAFLTGAIFAVSFDTIGIALGLTITGRAMTGPLMASLSVVSFGVAMIAVGGLNGLIVVQLISAANGRARKLLSLFSGTVGIANILLGCVALFALAGIDLLARLRLDGLVLTSIVLVPVLASAVMVSVTSTRLRSPE